MFGSYRLVLAWCVVLEHLSAPDSYFNHAGMFAVIGFYVLSGYLITRVLRDSYGFAFLPFWSNRFLRIYPTYFLLLAVALALVLGTAHAADFFPEVWKNSPALSDWIGLIAIFPMGFAPMSWSFRPVPPIWSVGVELLNYAVLFAVVARREAFAWAVAVAAAGYHVFSLWRGDELAARYFPFHAALLPFALGALIYFYTKPAAGRLSPRTALLLCAPALFNCIVAGLLGGFQPTPLFEASFYLNLVFQCLAVAALSLVPSAPSWRFDKLTGDLSYPVFLCHWLVGYVIAVTFFPGQWRSIPLMIATLVLSTVVAYFVCELQNAVIEPLRSRTRARAAAVDDRRLLASGADQIPDRPTRPQWRSLRRNS